MNSVSNTSGIAMTKRKSDIECDEDIFDANYITLRNAIKACKACCDNIYAIGDLNIVQHAYKFDRSRLPAIAKDIVSEYDCELQFFWYEAELDAELNALKCSYTRKLRVCLEEYIKTSPFWRNKPIDLVVKPEVVLDDKNQPDNSITKPVEDDNNLHIDEEYDESYDDIASCKPGSDEVYQIFLQLVSGGIKIYHIDLSFTAERLIDLIAKTERMSASEIVLCSDAHTLVSGNLYDVYGISRNSNIWLRCRLRGGGLSPIGSFDDSDGDLPSTSDSEEDHSSFVEISVEEFDTSTKLNEHEDDSYVIKVKTVDGVFHSITVSPSTSVEQFKNEIANRLSLPENSFILTFGMSTLVSGNLSDFGLGDQCVVYLFQIIVFNEDGERPLLVDHQYSVYVNMVNEGVRAYTVNPRSTVRELKEQIIHDQQRGNFYYFCHKCHDNVKSCCVRHRVFIQKVPIDKQLSELCFSDIVLRYETKTLTIGKLIDYGVEKDCTLHLSYKLKGGVRNRRMNNQADFSCHKLKGDENSVIRNFMSAIDFHVANGSDGKKRELYVAKITLSNRIIPEVSRVMEQYNVYENHQVTYRVTTDFGPAHGTIRYAVVFDPNYKNANCLSRAINASPISGVKPRNGTFDISIPRKLFSQQLIPVKSTSGSDNARELDYGFLYITRETGPPISGSFLLEVNATVRFSQPKNIKEQDLFPFSLMTVDGRKGLYVYDICPQYSVKITTGNIHGDVISFLPTDNVNDIIRVMPELPVDSTAVYEIGKVSEFPLNDQGGSAVDFEHILWDPNADDGEYFTPLFTNDYKRYFVNKIESSSLSDARSYSVAIKKGVKYCCMGQSIEDLELCINEMMETRSDKLSDDTCPPESNFSCPEASVRNKNVYLDSILQKMRGVVRECTNDIINSISTDNGTKSASIVECDDANMSRDDIRYHLTVMTSFLHIDNDQFCDSMNAVLSLFNLPAISDLTFSVIDLKKKISVGDVLCLDDSSNFLAGMDESYRWPLANLIKGDELLGLYFSVAHSDVFEDVTALQCFRIETYCLGIIKCSRHIVGKTVLPRFATMSEVQTNSDSLGGDKDTIVENRRESCNNLSNNQNNASPGSSIQNLRCESVSDSKGLTEISQDVDSTSLPKPTTQDDYI